MKIRRKKDKVLLKFLKQTRKGKYVEIDKSLLCHTRIKEQREPYYEDDYYYGWR